VKLGKSKALTEQNEKKQSNPLLRNTAQQYLPRPCFSLRISIKPCKYNEGSHAYYQCHHCTAIALSFPFLRNREITGEVNAVSIEPTCVFWASDETALEKRRK
jgi:hypothetical protein